LVKLRQYFIDNNLAHGNPIWTTCIVTLDIENVKINVKFKYKPLILD